MISFEGVSYDLPVNNNNNNNTLFNEDLQIKLQLVQLVSNLVLLSSRNTSRDYDTHAVNIL
jgi:hypothetical protein